MGVMAAHTVRQLVVLTPLMALATGRYVIRAGRPVAGMTIETVDFSLVGPARLFDFARLELMTFGAVTYLKLRS